MLKSFLQNGTIQSTAPIVNSKSDQVRDAEPIDTEEPLYVVVKNLPANAGATGDVVLIPGREAPLEDGMEAHSSILAWKSHGQRSWWATVHGVTNGQTRLSN